MFGHFSTLCMEGLKQLGYHVAHKCNMTIKAIISTTKKPVMTIQALRVKTERLFQQLDLWLSFSYETAYRTAFAGWLYDGYMVTRLPEERSFMMHVSPLDIRSKLNAEKTSSERLMCVQHTPCI